MFYYFFLELQNSKSHGVVGIQNVGRKKEKQEESEEQVKQGERRRKGEITRETSHRGGCNVRVVACPDADVLA
jgi:hypothetical protein